MIEYTYGWVYSIICNDTKEVIYIGSTTAIQTRIALHKHKTNWLSSAGYNKPMYQYIRKNGGFCSIKFKINWSGTIKNRYDLLEQEQKIIDTFSDKLRFNKNDSVNDFLLKNDPQQTNRERSLKYYYDNAGRINRHIECYCGSIITYNGRSMHKKTFRHMAYEPITLIPLFDE